MNCTPGVNSKSVTEENRTFSVYPKLPDNKSSVIGEEETWLELAQFVKDDLEWLLSLNHSKFWSHMIYSEQPRKLLVSFLKQAPPNYMRDDFLSQDEIIKLHREIEKLVFLVFMRLSTERESEKCYVHNLGEVLYNNYLFTIPIILDLCAIYGCSNKELVKNMLDTVITHAPNFWDDLQELLPHFLQVLKVVKEKLSVENLPKLKNQKNLSKNEIQDLIFYMHDSVSTLEMFLELYPMACKLFCKSKFVSEVVYFYSNVLPKVGNDYEKNDVEDLVENTRMDLLKLVKSVLDYLSCKEERKEEAVDEYLTLMMELLSETSFLSDYNKLYSIEFEIESLIHTTSNVDTMKVNHMLEAVSLVEESSKERRAKPDEGDVAGIKINSLITEVRDIFPHLEERFVAECLNYYDNNTERVVAAVLENSLPPNLNPDVSPRTSMEEPPPAYDPPRKSLLEYRGKHKPKFTSFNEMMDDREEIMEIRHRYAEFGFVADDNYDDEYDDTYDENIDVAPREADEMEKKRRPFVMPRVLRTADEEGSGEEEEEEEEEEREAENRDWFVPNPAEVREKNEQRRAEGGRRDVAGGARGRGQSRQVLRNREFKGTHKSSMGNHNRKKQASRKMHQGMIPS